MKNLLIAGSCMCCVMAILTDVALGSDESQSSDLENDDTPSLVIDLGDCNASLGDCNASHVSEGEICCKGMRFSLKSASKTVLVTGLGFNSEKTQSERYIKVRVPGSFDGKQVKIGEQAFEGLKDYKANIELEFYKKGETKVLFPENSSSLFGGCTSIKKIVCKDVDTSNVEDMSQMFSGCSNLECLDMSDLNVANVTSMEAMFSGCEKLRELIMKNLDAQKVKTMKNMFYNCKKLEELSLKGSKFINVEDMSGMFVKCRELKQLDLSDLTFDQVKTM